MTLGTLLTELAKLQRYDMCYDNCNGAELLPDQNGEYIEIEQVIALLKTHLGEIK
jgi:hypothetical protein